jgi:hypothetical protein
MKRLVVTLAAGAFGALLAYPIAYAQDYQDMSNDAATIRHEQKDIHQDKREQREDLEHGNFGAAASEQADIEHDRAKKEATERDLSNDVANHDADWARHHNDDDND